MGISSRINPQRFMIRQRLMSDPFCRLRSLPEVEVAAQLGIKIDVNQASVDDWLRLPGISIHQARSLVELVGMGVQLLCLEDVAAAIGVPIHRLQSLEPILHFEYYAPESSLNPQRINPNTAPLEEIARIPLIETSLAHEIIQNRQEYGNYRNLADLQRRLTLSSQLTSQLMYYLQF
jgi:DNA uptake protein ComE-like DNA-binding protein